MNDRDAGFLDQGMGEPALIRRRLIALIRPPMD